MVTVAAGENWDDLVARAVDARLGRRRGALRHPRRRSAPPRSRTSAPTARRSRRRSPASGSGTASCAASAPSPTPTAASATAPAGSRPTPAATSSSTSPSSSRRATWARRSRYAELAAHARRRAGRACAAGRRPRGGAGAAARQGHGARPDDHDTWSAGSFFTNPVVDADGRPRRRARLAQPRRHRQDQRRLADRARRLRQGLRPGPRRRPGRPLHQAHAGAHQPRRRHDRRAARPGPRGPRRGRGEVRDPAGQRAGAGRRASSELAVSRRGQPGVDLGEHRRLERRRAPARRGPTSGPARPAGRR